MRKRYIVVAVIVLIYMILAIVLLSMQSLVYPYAENSNTVEYRGTVKETQTLSESSMLSSIRMTEYECEIMVFSKDMLVADLPFELTKGGEVRFRVFKSEEALFFEGELSLIKIAELSYEGTSLVTLDSYNAVTQADRAAMVKTIAPFVCVLGVIALLLILRHIREWYRWKAGEPTAELVTAALGKYAADSDGISCSWEADYLKSIIQSANGLCVQILFSRKKRRFEVIFIKNEKGYFNLTYDKQFRREVTKELIERVGKIRYLFCREKYYGEELSAIMECAERRFASDEQRK